MQVKEQYRLMTVCLLIILLIAGCARINENAGMNERQVEKCNISNLSIENYFVKGTNIQSFDCIPSRVLVVGENEIETMLELGLEKHIVTAIVTNGRKFDMKEKNTVKLSALPKKSRAYLNVEYVTALKPNLIIAQQDKFVRNQLRDTDYWNERGIHTFVPFNTNTPSKHLYPETIENEMQFIQGLGEIFRVEDQAEEIIKETYDTIEDIRNTYRSEPPSKVMFVEFLSSLISYDSTKLAGNMAIRIGAQVPETSPVIGFEQLIQENPDVLFVVCSHADYGACITKITENPALQQLKCVKENRVYSIPLRFTYATSVRTSDGLRYMAQCIYAR